MVPFCIYFLIFLWIQWYSLYRTSIDSAHGFESQGGSIITCALLWLTCNDPQSHLWIPRSEPSPNFTHWCGEATAGVTNQCCLQDGWRIWTQDLAAQRQTLYWLSYPGRLTLLKFVWNQGEDYKTVLLCKDILRHSVRFVTVLLYSVV